jgi:hypothetical protein
MKGHQQFLPFFNPQGVAAGICYRVKPVCAASLNPWHAAELPR